MRRLILSVSSWEEKRSLVSPEEGVEGFLILQPVKSKAERGQQMLLNLFKLVTYLHLCIIVFMLRKTGWCRRSGLFSKLLDYRWKQLLYSEQAKKGVRTCTSQEYAITFVEIYMPSTMVTSLAPVPAMHIFSWFIMFTLPRDKSFVPSYILPCHALRKLSIDLCFVYLWALLCLLASICKFI
jgi:hypothetical protein